MPKASAESTLTPVDSKISRVALWILSSASGETVLRPQFDIAFICGLLVKCLWKIRIKHKLGERSTKVNNFFRYQLYFISIITIIVILFRLCVDYCINPMIIKLYNAFIFGGLMGTTSGVAAGLAATDPKLVPYGAMTATFYTGLGCLLGPSVVYMTINAIL